MRRIIKLFLVALTIGGITSLPVASDVKEQNKLKIERQNACNLIFNLEKTPEGQTTVTSIKMSSLRAILSEEETEMMRNICNLVFTVQPTTTVLVDSGNSGNSGVTTTTITTNKPHTQATIAAQTYDEQNDNLLVQPIYELQITAWPSDIDDIADAVALEEQEVIFPEEEAVLAQAAETDEPTVIPLYEDQLVIFPEISGFEEDNLSDLDNENVGISLDDTLDVWPPPLVLPTVQTPTHKPTVESAVEVVESFHTVHLNGTTEYKLILSNGLVNYKKIYNKVVDGEVITVQEGYDSVPIPGKQNEFQTQFYIADESGNNVYKFEHSYRKPNLPTFLSYTQQRKEAMK